MSIHVSYWTLMAWCGWLVTTGVLLTLYGLSGLLGREVFRRLRHAYHLHVIHYWLRRLEREGTHCFEKAQHPTNEQGGDGRG
jgi:hypothetical protein